MQKPEIDNTADTAKAKNKPTPLWSKLLTVAILLGVGIFAVSLLPRGYSQDISLIGKGGRVMVLLQEPFTVDGQEGVDAMNELRDEYEGRVQFILADKKVEQGEKFSELYNINSTAFVFFSPDGEILGVLYGGQKADIVRKNLNQVFGFNGV